MSFQLSGSEVDTWLSCKSNASLPLRCSGHRAGKSLWQQAVGHCGPAPEGQAGQAVQRTLAQPPQPQCEEVLVDGRGGPNHLQGPLPAGKPLGRDRQAAPWEVSWGPRALLVLKGWGEDGCDGRVLYLSNFPDSPRPDPDLHLMLLKHLICTTKNFYRCNSRRRLTAFNSCNVFLGPMEEKTKPISGTK